MYRVNGRDFFSTGSDTVTQPFVFVRSSTCLFRVKQTGRWTIDNTMA